MRLFFTPLILATLALATPLFAHQCILSGSSTMEIQIYNSCKADLAAGNSGHENASTDLSGEVLRLRADNDALRERLTAVKRTLLDLLGDL